MGEHPVGVALRHCYFGHRDYPMVFENVVLDPVERLQLNVGLGGGVGLSPECLRGLVPTADVAAGLVVAVVGDYPRMLLPAPGLDYQGPVRPLQIVWRPEAAPAVELRSGHFEYLKVYVYLFQKRCGGLKPLPLTRRVYKGTVVDFDIKSVLVTGLGKELFGPVRIIG